MALNMALVYSVWYEHLSLHLPSEIKLQEYYRYLSSV